MRGNYILNGFCRKVARDTILFIVGKWIAKKFEIMFMQYFLKFCDLLSIKKGSCNNENDLQSDKREFLNVLFTHMVI